VHLAEKGALKGANMSGPRYPKRIKKLLNELSVEAHEIELAKELGELAEKFEEWEEGKICAGELSFIAHEYETGPLRELFKFYNRAPVNYRVAYGVVEGFIGEEEIPEEVWPYIEGAIEFYKFRSGDEESSSLEGAGG
jgi:hypothetical protein